MVSVTKTCGADVVEDPFDDPDAAEEDTAAAVLRRDAEGVLRLVVAERACPNESPHVVRPEERACDDTEEQEVHAVGPEGAIRDADCVSGEIEKGADAAAGVAAVGPDCV